MTRWSQDKYQDWLARQGGPLTPPPTASEPKPQRRTDQAEQREQEWLVEWAAKQLFRHELEDGRTMTLTLTDVMFAIPNGAYLQGDSKQRAIQAGRLKRAGMKTGASDICIDYPRISESGLMVHPGCYIELKRPREQFASSSALSRCVSADQDAFLRLRRILGYYTAVAFGWQEAAGHICRYMGWNEKGRL